MPEPQIPHRIVHTRNRHSRAVYRGNEIIIRLARNLGPRQEQEHIESLRRRMTQHVVKELQKTHIDPFRRLLEGAERDTIELSNGSQYTIELTPGKNTRVRLTNEGWRIAIGPTLRRAELSRLLWRMVSVQESPRMEELVNIINQQTFNERIGSVRLRHMRSQWGSCSHRHGIVLNAALLFVPGELLHYVIVHELGHIRHQNHSGAFWNHLAEVIPECLELRRELTQFRICEL